MIDIKTEKGKTKIKEAHGPLAELLADTISIIASIHAAVEEQNPVHALLIRKMLEDGTYAKRTLAMIYEPKTLSHDSDSQVMGMLLQKLMEKAAKGGGDVTD